MRENKLIKFILNDIKELEILTNGMIEMTDIPEVMHVLAITKTRNLLDQFMQLQEISVSDGFKKAPSRDNFDTYAFDDDFQENTDKWDLDTSSIDLYTEDTQDRNDFNTDDNYGIDNEFEDEFYDDDDDNDDDDYDDFLQNTKKQIDCGLITPRDDDDDFPQEKSTLSNPLEDDKLIGKKSDTEKKLATEESFSQNQSIQAEIADEPKTESILTDNSVEETAETETPAGDVNGNEKTSEPKQKTEESKKEDEEQNNNGTVFANNNNTAQESAAKEKNKVTARQTAGGAIRKTEGRFINSLKRAITINDKIRYNRELFGGDMELMNKVIAKIDEMSSLNEAMQYLDSIFEWDEYDEAVADFYDLLEMRFS